MNTQRIKAFLNLDKKKGQIMESFDKQKNAVIAQMEELNKQQVELLGKQSRDPATFGDVVNFIYKLNRKKNANKRKNRNHK